jgi:hypothetical protein
MQPASLDEAERHVAVGSSHIERQEQIVADIDSQGRVRAATAPLRGNCLRRAASCSANTLRTATALSKS